MVDVLLELLVLELVVVVLLELLVLELVVDVLLELLVDVLLELSDIADVVLELVNSVFVELMGLLVVALALIPIVVVVEFFVFVEVVSNESCLACTGIISIGMSACSRVDLIVDVKIVVVSTFSISLHLHFDDKLCPCGTVPICTGKKL